MEYPKTIWCGVEKKPKAEIITENIAVASICILVIVFLVTVIKIAAVEKTTPKVESIKLGDKQTKVIVDDTTGCKYIVFNNKTLTPLYDKSGNVEGCGE